MGAARSAPYTERARGQAACSGPLRAVMRSLSPKQGDAERPARRGRRAAQHVSQDDPILQTRNLGKDFRGFTAVQNVDLRVARGSIHALIGPNGAGKTTCFNLLTRFLPVSRGTILFNGLDITRAQPQDVARRGMIRSFQISSVFARMSVLHNVRIALQRATGLSYQFWRSERALRHLDARAHELLEMVGLGADAQRRTVELPYGRKRALEIATTLATEPELMLLDEPTQGMGHEDVARITDLIRRVAVGRTVLMVEHNMGVVSGLCDRITVLARGAVLAEGSYAEISTNAAVLEAYMGGADADLAQAVH